MSTERTEKEGEDTIELLGGMVDGRDGRELGLAIDDTWYSTRSTTRIAQRVSSTSIAVLARSQRTRR